MGQTDKGLTIDAFEHLLRTLDQDREAAGEKYELLRRRLIMFFRARGTPYPDTCADDTLTIAASRIAGGEEIQNAAAYCLGIARLVAFDRHRVHVAEQTAARESVAVAAAGHEEPQDDRLPAFETCLAQLRADQREMILAYYGGEDDTRIARRKRLAEELGIPVNALRIRAHRIRQQLERAYHLQRERS